MCHYPPPHLHSTYSLVPRNLFLKFVYLSITASLLCYRCGSLHFVCGYLSSGLSLIAAVFDFFLPCYDFWIMFWIVFAGTLQISATCFYIRPLFRSVTYTFESSHFFSVHWPCLYDQICSLLSEACLSIFWGDLYACYAWKRKTKKNLSVPGRGTPTGPIRLNLKLLVTRPPKSFYFTKCITEIKYLRFLG